METEVETKETKEPEGSKELGIDSLPESWQKEIKALRKEAETHRKEKQKAIEAQEALNRQSLEEQGKFKELNIQLDTELKSSREKIAELETRYNQVVDARKNELLSRLPKEKANNYKDFPVEQLEIIVKDFSNTLPVTSPGTETSTGGLNFPETLDQFTDAQLEELGKHPELIKKYLGTNLGI